MIAPGVSSSHPSFRGSMRTIVGFHAAVARRASHDVSPPATPLSTKKGGLIVRSSAQRPNECSRLLPPSLRMLARVPFEKKERCSAHASRKEGSSWRRMSRVSGGAPRSQL